jgi:integrative and conjugative element protein (TIGR02256 family)
VSSSATFPGGWVHTGTSLDRPLPGGGVEQVSLGPGSWYTGRVGPDGEPEVRPSRAGRSSLPAARARGTQDTCHVVEFTERALEQLYREVMEALDGREAGGALYGYENDGRLVIEGVGPPWPGAWRTSTMTEISTDHCRTHELPYLRSGSRWVGDWHTHPGSSSHSPTDERAWRTGARNTHDPYVGVIASTGGDDGANPYFRPSLRAWIATTAHCRSAPIEFPT